MLSRDAEKKKNSNISPDVSEDGEESAADTLSLFVREYAKNTIGNKNVSILVQEDVLPVSESQEEPSREATTLILRNSEGKRRS
jgi:hypothetical protein